MIQSYLHGKYYFILIMSAPINQQTAPSTFPSLCASKSRRDSPQGSILLLLPINSTKLPLLHLKTLSITLTPLALSSLPTPIFPDGACLKAVPFVPNSTKYNEINIIFLLEESAMAQPEYRLKTTRSRLDFQLYQVSLPKYDPLIVHNIHIELPPSLCIRPDSQIARIFLNNQPTEGEAPPNGKPLLLATTFSGQLEAMAQHFQRIEAEGKSLFHLKVPQKKGQLAILSFRECDHRPRDETFLNSNFAGQSTAPKRNISDSVTLCEGCQTVLWKYYDREEIPITLGELCKVNSAGAMREMVEDFQWSIVLNQQFTPRTEIGRCQGQEMTLPYLAKATFLIDFSEHRKKLREDTVIMRIRRVICKHEKVMDDCCQFCLQQVKKEHLSQFTSYLFQNQNKPSSVMVTGSALRQHEEMYIDGLLSNNKAMIILDLDNTILHSCEISDLDIKTVLSLKDFYLIPKIDCPFQQEDKGKRDLIVVKMRPYFRHFLYVITKLYQVYVYTKGTRVYAQEICKYIRAQYAGDERTHPYLTWETQKLLFLQGKKSFATNIISRDQDSNLDSKSFDRILPSKTEYHLILDDRRDVWNNSPAWFFTREYYYFLSKGKKAAQGTPAEHIDDIGHYLENSAEIPMAEMKGSLVEEYKVIKTQYPQKKDVLMEVNARKDYFLLFAAYALRKIHKNFFEALKQEKQEGEKEKQKEGNMMALEQDNIPPKRKFNRINLAYQYNRTKHFFKSIKIQCFLGQGQDENNNNTIRRAKKMGATITDDSPQFIIRANDLIKQTKKPQIIPVPQDAASVPPPPTASTEVPAGQYYAKEKAELKELFDKKIPVVSQSWIHYCYEFHYPFSFKEFVLSDPYQLEVNHQDFSPYIDKEAKLILDKIEDEMARDINGGHKKQSQLIHPQPIRHKKEKKEHHRHHQKSII